MKTATVLLVFCAVASTCHATSPLSKVLDLMAELTAKITKEGEAEAKAYKEYFDWCDDMARNAGFEIKTAEAKKEKLEAQIGQLASSITASTSKIDELVASIAADDAELKDATTVREKEAADFAKNEAELMDAIDTLERAVSIISKEMAKNPAALAQIDTSSTARLVQTLGAVIDAAGFMGIDKQKLVALVQSQNSDDQEPGAPEAAVYKSHSSGIVDVLEDMKEKAESSLSDLRKEETNSKHNFGMLKQSLEDQMSADTKDMEDEKAAKAEAAEGKATAEGDLGETVKLLKNTKDELATASSTCMQVAADHEATVKSRDEELKAIATATKILKETTAGAASQTYSMLQVARLQNRADLAGMEVIQLVKQLAREHHSSALAQLASRMTAAIRFGAAGGEDPFAKVKGLIESMISKLEEEAKAEATEKAYCDEEMAKTEAKRNELMDDVSKVSAKLDQATSKTATLSAEIKQLEAELAALAKQQAEMNKIRQEENAAFVQAKADLTTGLTGVRQALTVLRDYYASDAALVQQPAMPELHSKASGASTSIIGILEVVESDFATGLAKEETQEDDAQAMYDDITQKNKVTKTLKDQDVKYKTAEVKSLAKAIADMSADKETLSTELAAVNEYYAKLKDRCIAKPETYEERKARREAEINGLKEALRVLDSETAFVQGSKRTHMRGALEA
jgi:septation ring formation regulator EzrA